MTARRLAMGYSRLMGEEEAGTAVSTSGARQPVR